MANKINYAKKMSHTTVNGNGAMSSDKTSHFEYMKKETITKKSHIENSIERLYGPGALCIGFQTRRSLIEQQRKSPIKELSNSECPKSLPRVFKHLRPEFRTQLFENNCFSNNDSKSSSQSSSKENIAFQSIRCKELDGPVVRHIPIQLEDNHCGIKKSEINGINNSFTKLEVNGKTPKSFQSVETPITKVVNNLGHTYNLRSRSMTPKNVNLISSSNILTPKTLNFTQSVATPRKFINEIQVKVEENEVDSGGKPFLKMVEVEVNYLIESADLIEKDINESGKLMDEELKGILLATVGKIRLLVSQKIKQFKGLCHKNVNGSPDDEFPTTDDDLAGFWDMVSLQIDSVKKLISEWTKVKENGWKEIVVVRNKETKDVRQFQKNKTTLTTEQKAQIEARKKAQEERRKAMREAIMAKRKQAKENEQIEIFVPKINT